MNRYEQRQQIADCGLRIANCPNNSKSEIRNPKCVRGFTLIEMMMGASIMTIVIVGLMGAFFGQSFLNTNARNLTVAMTDATRIMETIRQRNMAGQSPCSGGTPFPTAVSPTGSDSSWNQWLVAQGKSINQPGMFEHVAVTCQDGAAITCTTGQMVTCPDGTTTRVCPAQGAAPQQCPDGTNVAPIAPYCDVLQVSGGEWQAVLVPRSQRFDPIRVTVAVGWRQAQRTLGGTTSGQEFAFTTNQLVTSGKSTAQQTTGSLRVGPDTDLNGNGVIDSQAMLTTLVTCR